MDSTTTISNVTNATSPEDSDCKECQVFCIVFAVITFVCIPIAFYVCMSRKPKRLNQDTVAANRCSSNFNCMNRWFLLVVTWTLPILIYSIPLLVVCSRINNELCSVGYIWIGVFCIVVVMLLITMATAKWKYSKIIFPRIDPETRSKTKTKGVSDKGLIKDTTNRTINRIKADSDTDHITDIETQSISLIKDVSDLTKEVIRYTPYQTKQVVDSISTVVEPDLTTNVKVYTPHQTKAVGDATSLVVKPELMENVTVQIPQTDIPKLSATKGKLEMLETVTVHIPQNDTPLTTEPESTSKTNLEMMEGVTVNVPQEDKPLITDPESTSETNLELMMGTVTVYVPQKDTPLTTEPESTSKTNLENVTVYVPEKDIPLTTEPESTSKTNLEMMEIVTVHVPQKDTPIPIEPESISKTNLEMMEIVTVHVPQKDTPLTTDPESTSKTNLDMEMIKDDLLEDYKTRTLKSHGKVDIKLLIFAISISDISAVDAVLHLIPKSEMSFHFTDVKYHDIEFQQLFQRKLNKEDFSFLEEEEGLSPLWISVVTKQHNIVHLLLSSAKYDVQDDEMKHCLHCAKDSEEIKGILIKHICTYVKAAECKRFNSSNIIPGYECCSPDTLVLLVYSVDITIPYNKIVFGTNVKFQNPLHSNNEARKVAGSQMFHENTITATGLEDIKQVINQHGDDLFQFHSNLNIISASPIKSKRNGEEMQITTCIVLYCYTKGFIPLGERMFPTQLAYNNRIFPTDIREGYFSFCPSGLTPDLFNDPLRMGGGIGKRDVIFGGTLGPFVNIDNNSNRIGFLTCAHVFDPDLPSKPIAQNQPVIPHTRISVTQPAGHSFGGTDISNDAKECGFVTKFVFNPHLHIGVDAALVEITKRHPVQELFATRDMSQFPDVGLSSGTSFDSGSVKINSDPYIHQKVVVKFGSVTGLTRGLFSVNGTQVKVVDSPPFNKPSNSQSNTNQQNDVTMRNQYEIQRTGRYQFFALGDSGAGVFIIDNENRLHCVGLAIGVTDYDAAIVTPITAVLSALQIPRLKAFNTSMDTT